MKQDALKRLHCPLCGSPFELVDNFDIHAEEVAYGIVKCNCRRYPIVSGILALNTLDPNALNQAVGKVESRQPESALLGLLEPTTNVSRVIRAAKYRGLPFSLTLEKLRTKLMQRSLNKFLRLDSFSLAADYFKFISFGGYFKYRFSSSSFICGIPLTILMSDFCGPILEIGCGMGHHGFVISQLYPRRRLVLTDSSFVNLYLAKKFFIPQAEYICLNANELLPFASQSFNTVFASDSLHYLHSKKSAIEEFARVSKADNALIILSHLHNREKENPAAGEPLTASGWLNLVSFGEAKLFSETQVLKDFLTDNKLDLLFDSASTDIDRESAFALVATSRPGLFKVYPGLGGPFFNLRGRLVVNPLYQLSYKDNGVLLQKRWPHEFIRAENADIDKFLPDSLSLDGQLLDKVNAGKLLESDIHSLMQLLREFVLINVPAHY